MVTLPSVRLDESARYRDRRTGALEVERVFGSDALHFLYETRFGRALADSLVSHPLTNRLYGLLQRTPHSRAKIPGFVESLGIDASEAEHPLESYRSLDAFFARKLRPGARPIDPAPEHLLSPCDARVFAYAHLSGRSLPVKGHQVDVATLLDDARLAARYEHGAALVFRLAPADYHRFHFPADGIASRARRVAGRLHSVHPIALGSGAPSFRNQREISELHTERFGRVMLVEVGAMLVGTIVQTAAPGPVQRGAEKGTFRFGGSTVVVLLEQGRVELDHDLLQTTAEGLETLVRMGTRIGRALDIKNEGVRKT